MATGISLGTAMSFTSASQRTTAMARGPLRFLELCPCIGWVHMNATSSAVAHSAFLRYNFLRLRICTKDVLMALQINDKAPGITIPNEEGRPVSLKDFAGKNVVLFFFPKA